jgi:hypothetical protein
MVASCSVGLIQRGPWLGTTNGPVAMGRGPHTAWASYQWASYQWASMGQRGPHTMVAMMAPAWASYSCRAAWACRQLPTLHCCLHCHH